MAMTDEPILDTGILDGVRQVMDPPLLAHMIEVLDRTSRETLDLLAKSLAQGDLETARRAAHKLKGSAGNLGLRRLYATAAALEGCADEAEAQSLAQSLPPLFEESLIVLRRAIA